MVGQDEKSPSDGKTIIPTSWTGTSGLLEKICLFVLVLYLRIREIGELLTGEVFSQGDRGIWWVRLSAMYEGCRHGSGSLETFGHGYSRRRITALSLFLLQNTPLSGSALADTRFPIPKSPDEKQVCSSPSSVARGSLHPQKAKDVFFVGLVGIRSGFNS